MRLAPAALAVLALLATAPAAVAEVRVEYIREQDTSYVLVHGDATKQDVSARRGGGQNVVVEPGPDNATPLTAGDGCVASFGGSVVCDSNARPGEVNVVLQLMEGDDIGEIVGGGLVRVTLNGGDGNDQLTGGDSGEDLNGDAGDDTLVGGPGNDTFDGGEGSDESTGGPNSDVFFDSGNAGTDTVLYTDKTASVNVSFFTGYDSGNATDGSPFSPTQLDTFGPGIDRVEGTDHDDTFAADNFSKTFVGHGGRDRMTGGHAPDRLLGGAGDDTLDAHDGVADLAIDCGDGTDTAKGDDKDPQPVACETATGFAAGGTTTPPPTQTTTTTQPSGTPPGATTTPTTPTPGMKQACVPAPVSRCYEVPDSLTVKKVPNLVGLTDDQALNVLNALGIELAGRAKISYDKRARTRLPSHPRGRRWAENMVTRQSIPPGTVVPSGSGGRLSLDLRLWDGKDRETCTESANELKGVDLDTFRTAMAARGCKVDDVRLQVKNSTTRRGEVDGNSGDRCELVRASRSSGRINEIDLTVAAPDTPALTDLRVSVKEFPGRPSFMASESRGEHWTLPRGASSFVVVVQDREGALINNVDVYLDASRVTGVKRALVKLRTGSFQGSGRNDQGMVPVSLSASRTGTVRIVAFGAPASGGSVCGSAEVRVTDPGDSFFTLSGNYFKKSRSGAWELKKPPARAAAIGDVFAGIGQFFTRLWGTVSSAISGDVVGTLGRTEGSVRARVREVVKVHDAGLLQMGAGQPIGGGATLAQSVYADGAIIAAGTGIGSGKARLVAAGAGNVIFGQDKKGNIVADPSRLIGADGASLIGADGATLIGADGATLVGNNGNTLVPQVKDMAKSAILSHNGGAVIARDGAGVLSHNGGQVLSHNGGTLVAAGGGNLVAAGGGNLVAAGAGN